MDIREKLIQEVKKNPALYDKTNEDYKKYEHRLQIWTDIGQTLGLSASDAQAKWKNLRDNMVKHLKRTTADTVTGAEGGLGGGQGGRKTKQYKFAQMLHFIVPFLELSRTEDVKWIVIRSNDQSDSTNGPGRAKGYADKKIAADSDNAEEHPTPRVKATTNPNNNNSNNTRPTAAHPKPSQSSSSSPPASSSLSPPSRPPTKRQRRSNRSEATKLDPPTTTTSTTTTSRSSKTESGSAVELQETDDIGLFLSSMAGSIRKLPADVQATVRFSIHKVVHDAEMAYLFSSSSSSARRKEDRS